MLNFVDIAIVEQYNVSEKYLTRMNRKSVHNSKFDIIIGDIVIIKKILIAIPISDVINLHRSTPRNMK